MKSKEKINNIRGKNETMGKEQGNIKGRDKPGGREQGQNVWKNFSTE